MLTQYLKQLTEYSPFESLTAPLQQLAALPRRLSRSTTAHNERPELLEEPKLLAAAYRLLLLPQSNALDAGADVVAELGMLVSLAPEGKHVAFEPEAHKARRLRRRYPGVDVRETALLGAGLRNEPNEELEPCPPPADALDILAAIRGEGRSLDGLIGQELAIDLLRLRADGAELFVLMGAEQLLLRCRPSLIFSSSLDALAQWELRPQDVFEYLSGLGYRLFLPRAFVTSGGPLSCAEFSEAHAAPALASHFIATAPERICGRRLVQRDKRNTQPVPLAGQANVA